MEKEAFTLFIENDLDFKWSLSKLVESVKKFVLSGKERDKIAIAQKGI